MTEHDTLWLPGNVTKLWNDAIEPIAALLGGWGENARWGLGGGTLLAMRWGNHRFSTDLDIVVFPDQEVTLWAMHVPSNTALAKLTAQLAKTGIRPWGDLDNPNQRRYERDGQHIDLFEARPVPPGEERVATVNGQAVKTLSTTQILHGKLARLRRTPVRDLYDFASALVHDPDALANAVGLRQPTVLLQDTAITLARRDELRVEGRHPARRDRVRRRRTGPDTPGPRGNPLEDHRENDRGADPGRLEGARVDERWHEPRDQHEPDGSDNGGNITGRKGGSRYRTSGNAHRHLDDGESGSRTHPRDVSRRGARQAVASLCAARGGTRVVPRIAPRRKGAAERTRNRAHARRGGERGTTTPALASVRRRRHPGTANGTARGIRRTGPPRDGAPRHRNEFAAKTPSNPDPRNTTT